MSKTSNQLDFQSLSDELHLFICPMFSESNAENLKKIEKVQIPRTNTEICVQYNGDKPQEIDGQPTDASIAKDLIRDFLDYIKKLNEEMFAGWDLDSLGEDIARGLESNRSVFSPDSCWFHISHPEAQCVLEFTKRFFRRGDNPGIVFGYYHKKSFYSEVWGDHDPRGRIFKDFQVEGMTDQSVAQLIAQIVDKTGPLAENPAATEAPALEVSLRIPIKKPHSTEDQLAFSEDLQKVRDKLRQNSIGIFDQMRKQMHYLDKDGWSSGPSKFVKPSMAPGFNRSVHNLFLNDVSNAVKTSATISQPQRNSVHNPRAAGTTIPANQSYLYDLLTQKHLGFSFFPPVSDETATLNDLFLLEGGRWLWNSVFPYRTKELISSRSPLLVLLHTDDAGDRGEAKYNHYVAGSTCVCGNCYPGPHLQAVPRARLGDLRSDCPDQAAPQVDAGDPEAVLLHAFYNAPDSANLAGSAWEVALTRIT